MEQNRELRNKLMHLQSINLQQRRQKYTMQKRQSLQQVMLGKLDSYIKRMILKCSPIPHTKINSEWFKDLNIRQDTIIPRREHRQNILRHKSYKYFLR